MNFQTAVKTCLTEKYATFQGRASRSEHWWFILAVMIGALVTSLIWWVLYMLFALAMIVPTLAAGARRLQDTGRPGWYIAIPFGLSLLTGLTAPAAPDPAMMTPEMMPGMGSMALFWLLALVQFVVALVFLWWLTRPSDPAPNEYGAPPVR